MLFHAKERQSEERGEAGLDQLEGRISQATITIRWNVPHYSKKANMTYWTKQVNVQQFKRLCKIVTPSSVPNYLALPSQIMFWLNKALQTFSGYTGYANCSSISLIQHRIEIQDWGGNRLINPIVRPAEPRIESIINLTSQSVPQMKKRNARRTKMEYAKRTVYWQFTRKRYNSLYRE